MPTLHTLETLAANWTPMRPIATIIIILFTLSNTGNCQELMKIREIFDFEVGDIFQFKDDAFIGDNGETIRILSKSISENQDTLYYSASRVFYYKLNFDSLQIIRDTIGFTYTNLDSSYFELIPEYKYDTILKYWGVVDRYDTINEYNARLCNELINGFLLLAFEAYREFHYAKGLGEIKKAINISDSPGDFWNDKEMVYFKKADKQCGEFDLTNTNAHKSPGINVIAFPNPALNILYVEIKTEKPIAGMVYLFDLSGNLMLYKNIGNKFEINVSNLPPGEYFMNIRFGKNIINKTFIVE